MNAVSRSRIASTPTAALRPNTRPGPDRLDDRRRPALLAVLDVGQVDVLERVDVLDRAAARHRRHAVPEQLPARDQDARRARPADELVGRDEHRVLRTPAGRPAGPSRSRRTAPRPRSRRTTAPRARGAAARSRTCWTRCRSRSTRPRRSRSSAADPRTAPAPRAAGPGRRGPSRSSRIVTTSAIDSRHGSSLQWCSNGPMNTTGRCSGGIRERRSQRSSRSAGMRRLSTSTRRLTAAVDPEPQKMTACGLGVAADALEHQPPRLLAEARRLEPGAGRLGVGVRVERQDRVADVVLDERQAAARRRVVRVGHAADPVRPRDRLVVADDGRADPVDQRVRRGGRVAWSPWTSSLRPRREAAALGRPAGYGMRTGSKLWLR